MSIYLNAFLMLAITLVVFFILAKLLETIRAKQRVGGWGISRQTGAAPARLAIVESCVIDSKRRLLLVRCDEQRVLLMTGGSTDLIVSMLPAIQTTETRQ